jgi:hypothetical protein
MTAFAPHFSESVTNENGAPSRLDSTRNLPNLDLKPGYEEFGMTALLDFRGIRSFQKQFHRFLQVVTRGFNGAALAGYVELRAQGNVAVPFTFNDRGNLPQLFHVGSHIVDVTL